MSDTGSHDNTLSRTDLILALLTTIFWGFNFSSIKLGLEIVDPFVLATLRFFLCAFPFVFFFKRPSVPSWVVWAYGALFGGGLWGLVNLGIASGVPAGLAALLVQFAAFFTILEARAFLSEKISKAQYAAIILSVTGLAMLIEQNAGSYMITGIGLTILGAFAWSLCNLLVRIHKPSEIMSFIVWSSIPSTITLFVITLATRGLAPFLELPHRLTAGLVVSLVSQSYVTTIIGYTIWNSLLKKYPTSIVAPLGLIVPVVGILSSWLFFGDQISIPTALSMFLILIGVACFINAPTLNRYLVKRRIERVSGIASERSS